MADNQPTHEPNRPNYAELKNEHAEAQERQQQQQEIAAEPTRPDSVRSAGWTDRGDMQSQQRSATEHAQRANEQAQSNWKELLKNPELAQKMHEQREQQQTAQRENEGPEHDNTGGRERV
jgi:hypothetical protein